MMNEKVINDNMKSVNVASTSNGWINNNKENAHNRRRTLMSINSKPSLKLDIGDEFRMLMEQKDMIVSDNKFFSNTTHNIKRTSIDLTTNSAPNIYM